MKARPAIVIPSTVTREPSDWTTLLSLFKRGFIESAAADEHGVYLDRLCLRVDRGFRGTVGTLLGHIYGELLDRHRCEYVYKNEAIRQIFLTNHDPGRASVLSEVPIEGWTGRVDLVVASTTGAAYEIKTDLDSLSRLPAQLSAALRLFDEINVVCSEQLVDAVGRLADTRVGLYVLDREATIHRIRRATSNLDNVDNGAIFDSLSLKESRAALEKEVGPLPQFGAADEHRACRVLFSDLPKAVAHKALVDTYRRHSASRYDSAAIEGVPYSAAHLFYRLRPRLRERLLAQKPFERRFFASPRRDVQQLSLTAS